MEEESNRIAYSDTKDSMWIKYVLMILKVCWMLQTAYQQASHMTNQGWLENCQFPDQGRLPKSHKPLEMCLSQFSSWM